LAATKAVSMEDGVPTSSTSMGTGAASRPDFVIFVDAYTKYICYYHLVAKSDVYFVFHQLHTLVKRQFSLKIKSVQTDWDGE
jgi:hypothetical protein